MTSAGAPQGDRIRNHAAFIWSVADLLLRGDFKQSQRRVLPQHGCRCRDLVLEPMIASTRTIT
jgi:hypothetical protein